MVKQVSLTVEGDPVESPETPEELDPAESDQPEADDDDPADEDELAGPAD